MIITVRGTKEGGIREAAACAALLSSMTAIVKSKKTVVMQFTGMEAPSVLNYLEGKQIKDNEISQAYALYADDGIDALLIRAETADLSKEHFDDTVTALLDKTNLFDVLKRTDKKDFYELLSAQSLENILTGAKQIYDYVYVLIPEVTWIIEKVTELADENIIVVPQGPGIDLGPDVPYKLTVLAYDFEKDSMYEPKALARAYGVRTVYTLPPNFLYRDAVYSETLLDFVLKNKKDMREDFNYDFTHSVMKLLGQYVAGDNDDDEEDIEETLPVKAEKGVLSAEPILELPDEAIQETTVKRGFFGRKKKKLTADI